MDKLQATTLISNTFEKAFNETQYLGFLRELFNQIDDSADRKIDHSGNLIPNAFKGHVRRYKRLGTYTDPSGEPIDLLVVYLHQDNSLDRARTMQRNFAAYHLKQRTADNAIIAYVSDSQSDWRFSMVRREPVVTFSEAGNLISKDELTPVRRYSFLVGENEPNHTAQQQLFPILMDDKHDPTLYQLENAFNIETVTKEFFEQYKNLFLQLKEELDRLTIKDSRVQAEFMQQELDTTNFAKKLLGQIVFLYFLQKKGWLGVELDGTWGTGSKSFLRELFNQVDSYDNFFNDILEPLFYEALAIERRDNVYPRLNTKIPFLNGGLFEPVGNYDWRNIDILVDNSVFNSIFDTFDLYNFTVREDEPLEKEVAVDPEMLGKVFENLLEVTDRKSKGAFYTPREIVHYMCQESLINYLDTRVNIGTRSLLEGDQPQQKLFEVPPEKGEQLSLTEPVQQRTIARDDIATFIRVGELAVHNDIAKEAGTVSYTYQMPETIRANAAKLDAALASIKICDPAIGSGAFPVGMMQEIIKARQVLTTYLPEDNERTTYHFKRQAIQESIYGVDMDPSAIDIAKLRLWLSLVVDEDDYHHIKPLPNLDYKIICGNSLSAVDKTIFNYHLFEELEQLKGKYFDVTDPNEKHSKKREIDEKIAELTNNNNSFDFEIYFSEIFPQTLANSQRGFDVVIANPPYIRHERITEFKSDLERLYPEVYTGTADLYVYFFAKGLRILKTEGVLTFITPNKFLLASYGKKLRQHLSKETAIELLIDFGDLHIFDASTYPFITVTRQQSPKKSAQARFLIVEDMKAVKSLSDAASEADLIRQSSLRADGWQLIGSEVMNLLDKLRSVGNQLTNYIEGRFYRGLVTGSNDAFVINHETYEALLKDDPKNAEIIRPWLRGRDIKKWHVLDPNLYVLYITWECPIEDYPAVLEHLNKHKDQLSSRPEVKDGRFPWYALSRYGSEFAWAFEMSKIIYQEIATFQSFAYTTHPYFTNNKCYIIPTENMYLLGILNSNVTWFFLSNITSKLQGGAFAMQTPYVSQIPIAVATLEQQKSIEGIVKRLLEQKIKRSEIKYLEKELNRLVYQIYKLNNEETFLIEKALLKGDIIKADSALSELTDLTGDF